jgi:lipoprotein signal peptidase
MATELKAKAWYQSWTIWANLLALALVVANGVGFGDFEADPWVVEVGTVITLVINILLRYFRTSAPIAR